MGEATGPLIEPIDEPQRVKDASNELGHISLSRSRPKLQPMIEYFKVLGATSHKSQNSKA